MGKKSELMTAVFDNLERQIERRLAEAKAKQVLYHGHLAERMIEADREQRCREEVAERARDITEKIVRPRLLKLAGYFDNAEIAEPSQAGDERCICNFRHTERFPASTKLELTAQVDGDSNVILLKYQLQILPIFFEFEHEDQLALPANAVDEAGTAAWVETKLLKFLDTYLRLQEIDPYQQENLVTDPVCGMRFNKLSAAAEMQLGGRVFYFCVRECRDKFAADPHRYVSIPDQIKGHLT